MLSVHRANSHKKDVLYFCGERARICREHIDMLDRESAGLIWRLLELLIKQNGVGYKNTYLELRQERSME